MKLELIEKLPLGLAKNTPILFVHGAWHGAWCWDEFLLPYFAERGYPSYALSFQGHGTSGTEKQLNSLRIADYVSDVAQVAASLPNPPILVGHSMGGLVVQKYLEKYPAAGAVLLASLPVGGLGRSALRMAKRHPWLFLKSVLSLNISTFIRTKALAHESFFSTDIDADVLEKCYSRLQGESYFAFLDMILLNLPRPKRIAAPLLVMGASDDKVISPKDVARTAKAYHTKAILIEGTAHDMMLENTWQIAADVIIGWLREQGF
jgi:pimeloyl-ACP methyl ester carboxylesterase